jgi:hypothetical protein
MEVLATPKKYLICLTGKPYQTQVSDLLLPLVC